MIGRRTPRWPRRLAGASLVLLAPAVLALSVECGPPPDGAICADGPWFEFAAMSVAVAQGDARSRYEIVVGAGRDLKVSISEDNPRYRGTADAMLIDGSMLATRSDGALPSRGPDLLNDPLLAAQEVASVLQIALPKGPTSIARATPVNATGTRFLAANTPAMSSYYGPPWKVEGSVKPAGPRTVAFEFTLAYRVGQPDGTVTAREHVHRYSGRASYPATRPRLPDRTSLDGWTIEVPGGATGTETLRFKTLGQARRVLGVAPAR
jgi:hypothetical protein